MRNTLLFLLCFCSVSFGQLTERVWDGSESSDMNVSDNWTGGSGTPSSTDSLVFDATTSTDATASADLDVGAINSLSTYTGNISFNGYNHSYTSDALFGHTGTLDLCDTLTMTGASATLQFNNTVTTLTASSCVVIMQGETGMSFVDNENILMDRLIIDSFAVVTVSGSGAYFRVSGKDSALILRDSCSFTNNKPLSFSISTLSVTPFLVGNGVTWNGTGYVAWGGGGATTVVTIPEFTYTGGGYFNNGAWPNTTGLGGNIDLGTAQFTVYSGLNQVTTLNTNGYDMICGRLAIGKNSGSGRMVADFDSSTLDIVDYNPYALGTNKYDFGSSQWTVSSNWAFVDGDTIDMGTSKLTFDGASQTLMKDFGYLFYDIEVNKTTAPGTWAYVDTADSSRMNDLTLTNGQAWFGKNLYVRDLLNNNPDTVKFEADRFVSRDLTFASGNKILATAGAWIMAGGILTLADQSIDSVIINGNTTINGGGTIQNLSFGTQGKKLTLEAGKKFTLTELTASDFNGANGSPDSIVSSSPGTACTLSLPNSITLKYMYFRDIVTDSTINCPWDSGCRSGGGNY